MASENLPPTKVIDRHKKSPFPLKKLRLQSMLPSKIPQNFEENPW